MTPRKKFIIIILFVATIDWALWVGGQFFNALMVIPGWSANIPKSIQLYQQNMLSHISSYFFLTANPLFLLPLLIISWILCLRYKTAFSKWFGVTVLLDLFITLIVGLWMAPIARSVFAAAAGNNMNIAATLSMLHTWKIANGCRIGLGIITFLFFLMSIEKIHLLGKYSTGKESLEHIPQRKTML